MVAWDDQMDLGSLVNKFWEFLNRAPENDTPAEFTITADGASGSGVPSSSRAVREEENECAIGGLRNAARSVSKLPNWSLAGSKVGALIEVLVVHHEEVLSPVLDSLGKNTDSHVVPETLCAILRLRMKDMFGLCDEDLQPGPGGFFPGLIRGLTEAALDPDVHIHEFRFHLVEFSQWFHLSVWTDRKIEFAICTRKSGAPIITPIIKSTS